VVPSFPFSTHIPQGRNGDDPIPAASTSHGTRPRLASEGSLSLSAGGGGSHPGVHSALFPEQTPPLRGEEGAGKSKQQGGFDAQVASLIDPGDAGCAPRGSGSGCR